MRVIHIVGDSKFGGDAYIILYLAELARTFGWEVSVLATDPTAQRFYRDHNLNVVDLDVIRRPIRPAFDIVGLWRLYRFFKANHYDLVHTHTSKASVLGRIAARWAGVPYIVYTVHLFGFHEQSSFVELVAYSTIERTCARFCDRIVTVSDYHRQLALRYGIGSPEQVYAVPNGIDADLMVANEEVDTVRSRFGAKPDDIVILSTGRLAEQKGLEYLILATRLMRKRNQRRFVVWLAGTGEKEEDLKKLINDIDAKDCVKLLGFQRDIPSLLRAADIVALPSLWEGLSISLLEAMAMARPIVTTTIGPNCEVVKDGMSALLVPPKDPIALSMALDRLIDDPGLREQLGREAARVVRADFSLHKMVEGYRKIYEELIKTGGRK